MFLTAPISAFKFKSCLVTKIISYLVEKSVYCLLSNTLLVLTTCIHVSVYNVLRSDIFIVFLKTYCVTRNYTVDSLEYYLRSWFL